MATEQQLRGQWNQVSGAVKEKYGEISDDDIRQSEGNVQKLIGLIQEKTGQSREQVEAFFHEVSEQVSERARAGYEYSSEAVAQRPVESVLGAFAVGIVAGIAIGLAVAGQRRPEPSWHTRWTS